MLTVCYPGGALGFSIGALMDCCTKEGGNEFPVFYKGENLHHHVQRSTWYELAHPVGGLDFIIEKRKKNIVIGSNSESFFGRLLIKTMLCYKWFHLAPDVNQPSLYFQGNGSYGDQLEKYIKYII
jgi:hypothetical protein